MRLGSEAQLGTSIATFSADGAGSFTLKESRHENNAQCARGQDPWLNVSTSHSLPVPLPSKILTLFSGKGGMLFLPTAEAGTMAVSLWEDGVPGSAHIVRKQ